MSSKILCLLCVLCFSGGVWAQAKAKGCDPVDLAKCTGAQTWDQADSITNDGGFAQAQSVCEDNKADGWEWVLSQPITKVVITGGPCPNGIGTCSVSQTVPLQQGFCRRSQNLSQDCKDLQKEAARADEEIDKAKDTKSQFDDASKAQDAVLEKQNAMKEHNQNYLDAIQKAQDDFKEQVKQINLSSQKNAVEGAQKIREQTTAIAKMTADKLAEASLLQGLQNAYNNKVASDTGSVLNDLATACYYGNTGGSSSGASTTGSNAGPGGAENVMSSGANAKLRWNSCIIQARGKLKAEEDDAWQKVQTEINRQSKMAADLLAAQQNLTAIQGVQQANQTNANQDTTDATTKYQAQLARLTMKNSQDAQSDMAAVANAQMNQMQATKALMTNQPKLTAINKYNSIIDQAETTHCCPPDDSDAPESSSSSGEKTKSSSSGTFMKCKKKRDTSGSDPTQQAAGLVQMLTGFQNAKNGGGNPMMSIPGAGFQ